MRKGGDDINKSRRVIAVTGKGGSGKTTLVAILAKILVQNKGLKFLVIDADSAIGLPQTLGVKVKKTISDIREEIITVPEARRKLGDTHIRTTLWSMVEKAGGIHLLVMGRPEGPGCFCAINDLLKYGIETLSKEFAVTVIDGEAGPEQINRRVISCADTLIIVADSSIRSIETASSIKHVAELGEQKFSQIGLVINRMKKENRAIIQVAHQMDMRILGFIPEDENITEYDSIGHPIFELPDSSTSVIAVEKILMEVGLNIFPGDMIGHRTRFE